MHLIDFADIYLGAEDMSRLKTFTCWSKLTGEKSDYSSESEKIRTPRRRGPDRPTLVDGTPVNIHRGKRSYLGRAYILVNGRILLDCNRYGVAAWIIPVIYFSLYGKVDDYGRYYSVDLSEISLSNFEKVPHTRNGLRRINEELKASGFHR